MPQLLVILIHAVFLAAGAWLIHVDIQEHRLPNRIVFPTFGVLLLLISADAVVRGDVIDLRRASLAACVLFVAYLALQMIAPEGVGGGDVKLAAVVGLFLGWHGWHVFVLGAAAAFFVGGAWAILLITTHRGTGKTAIAFCPCMILGAWAGLLGG
ncbi:MAG: prepilin peptidase [Microbacterium sp.]